MSLPDTPYTDIQSVDDFSPEKTMANRFHNEPCQEGFTEQKKFNDDLWDLLMVLHHEVVDNRKLETMRTSAALDEIRKNIFQGLGAMKRQQNEQQDQINILKEDLRDVKEMMKQMASGNCKVAT